MTLSLSSRGQRRVGVRAADYIAERAVTSVGGSVLLVPDESETPPGVATTLTRIYGRPRTHDRGEVAYWTIDGRDIERDAR